MSVKIISKDETGNPKRFYFKDICTCSTNKTDTQTESETETKLSDEARERMIMRNKDAWKK